MASLIIPSRLRWSLVVSLAWLIAMAIVFRAPLASGMDLGFGDRADGLIEISLLEHWHRWWTGGAGGWRETLYFHPYGNTLGYNDGYFLFGLIFSFWRRWLDPFLADTLNIATWKTIGFFTAYCLVASVLRWQRGAALLIAFLFSIANGMTVQAGHAQLQLVALVPLFGMLAVLMLRAASTLQSAKAAGLAALLALLMAAWLLTGFYLAWFTLYFLTIAVVIWGVSLGRRRWSAVFGIIALHWRAMLIFALCLGIACAPFLMVYVPKLHETGGHDFRHDVRPFLVTPVDIANVGRRNYLWGWVLRGLEDGAQWLGEALHIKVKSSWITGEHCTGFPLIFLTLLLISLKRVFRKPMAFAPGFRLFALTVGISWLLTIQLGPLSPWHLVHWIVPGARGLRVVVRYQLWLILPALIVIAGVWRDRFADLYTRRPAIAAFLVTLLIAEQINGEPTALLSRKQQLTELSRIPAPPAHCRAFYVVNARGYDKYYRNASDTAFFAHNIDAMFLAQQWGLPTVNGVSTFNSPDWDFKAPNALDYDARVSIYARRHHISSLCRLDARQDLQWSTIFY